MGLFRTGESVSQTWGSVGDSLTPYEKCTATKIAGRWDQSHPLDLFPPAKNPNFPKYPPCPLGLYSNQNPFLGI